MREKKVIRKKMKLLRKIEVLQNNYPHSAAKKFLKNTKLKKTNIIGLYWPILYELDTRPLIKVLSEKGFQLALPAVQNEKMFFLKWKVNDSLFYSNENFYAPSIKSIAVKPQILIVPMLAFDSKGYRLGYGKGYYDKYFYENKKAVYYGYGYDMQFIKNLPQETHDLKLNCVITEKKFYKF